ncbi:MAG: hypothetical protein RL199_791 [Pseudomonadota bacterium]
MSTQALQRLYIRCLFDSSLHVRLRQDGRDAAGDADVTDAELGWLLACDPRLFTADAMRPRRSLKALLDEFKASSALAVAATGRLAALDGFFASATFHEAIQDRGSLALAYGTFLASLASHDPRIGAVAAIERALAKARRGRPPAAPRRFEPSRSYRLAGHVGLATVPSNALAVMQAVEQVLFEIALAPVAALASDGPRLDRVPTLASGDAVTLLAVRGEGDHAALEELPEALAALLSMAGAPVTGAALVECAASLGGDAGVVAECVRDGLLGAA